MDFSKVENFLRTHWPAAIIVTMLSVPAIWTIAHIHFSQEINLLKQEMAIMKTKVEALEEYKKRMDERETKFVSFIGGNVGFQKESLTEKLFTPPKNQC